MKNPSRRLHLLLLLTIIASTSLISQTGWYSTSITTDELNTVFFVDSLHGWVGGTLSIGGLGVIRKTTDGGATWVSQTLPVTDAINRILFLTSSVGFAVGGNGAILKTTDAGTTWLQKRSGTGLESIFFFDSQHGWACGVDTVLSTTDQGTTWSASVAVGVGGIYLFDVSFRTLQEGWAVGLYGACFKSTNSGGSWSPTTPPITGVSLFGVRFPTPSKGIIIGGDQIALSTDAGNSWNSAYSGGGSQLNSLSFADSLNGWVAGTDKIVRTTDGGFTWHEQPWQPYRYLNAVYGSNPFHAWAVGDQIILKTTNGGFPTSVKEAPNAPSSFGLKQNFPNPFNPATTIRFSLARSCHTILEVFDLRGVLVETLIDSDLRAGEHEVVWNAGRCPSGLYICRLRSGSFADSNKLILLK